MKRALSRSAESSLYFSPFFNPRRSHSLPASFALIRIIYVQGMILPTVRSTGVYNIGPYLPAPTRDRQRSTDGSSPNHPSLCFIAADAISGKTGVAMGPPSTLVASKRKGCSRNPTLSEEDHFSMAKAQPYSPLSEWWGDLEDTAEIVINDDLLRRASHVNLCTTRAPCMISALPPPFAFHRRAEFQDGGADS